MFLYFDRMNTRVLATNALIAKRPSILYRERYQIVFFQIYIFVKKNNMMYRYTREMLYHLFSKNLSEQNVINMCNSDIITGTWSHYSHTFDTYGLFSHHLL